MNIFFKFNGIRVNISKIKEISIARKDAIRITFDDGSTDIFSTYGDAEDALQRFDKTILQLYPCVEPTYNIYQDGDETYFRERVHYLALCADGEIRSVAGTEGFIELADVVDNFVGCFNEKRLEDYPESDTEEGVING
jgi:hypothetical protein